MSTELAEPDDLATRAKRANREHKLAGDKAKLAVQHAKNCGEELMRIKGLLGHGKFLPWLKENFEGSDRTARAYMRIAENWQCIANLDTSTLTGALAALSPAKPSAGAPVIECEATVIEERQPDTPKVHQGPALTPEASLGLDAPIPISAEDPLAISAAVRKKLDSIGNLEGLNRVAIFDVLRYCCNRLGLEFPRRV
jgi:hypothetical protein